MRLTISLLTTLLCIALSAILWARQTNTIELAVVPAKVIQAAQNAKAGIRLTEAEKIEDNGKISYELEGSLGEDHIEFLFT